MDYPRAKKIYALIPAEREQECIEHRMRFIGRVPNSGPIQCYLCGSEKRGYVSQSLQYLNKNGITVIRNNKCPTCNLTRAEPDPMVVGPITEVFPSWACPNLWCGYENGNS